MSVSMQVNVDLNRYYLQILFWDVLLQSRSAQMPDPGRQVKRKEPQPKLRFFSSNYRCKKTKLLGDLGDGTGTNSAATLTNS